MPFYHRIVSLFTVAALLLSAARPSVAQETAIRPAMVVSITNVNRLMGDVMFLTRAVGKPALGAFVTLFAGPFTQGVDKTKPIGAWLTASERGPGGVAFVPVEDFKALMQGLEQRIGEPEDTGDGVLRFDLQRPGFAKHVDGWLYFSDSKENLATLPDDPAALLGGMGDKYDIGVRVNVQNIPQQFRDLAVEQIKQGFKEVADQLDEDEAGQLQATMNENTIQQLVMVIEQADEFTIGFGTDSKLATTFLDISITALPNTKLATQMALVENSETAFAGFAEANSALTLNFAGNVPQEDIARAMVSLKTVRERAMQEIDNDNKINDDVRRDAKDILGNLLNVIEKTLQSGRLDAGAAVVLDTDAVNFIAGGKVSDVATLDKSLRDLDRLARQENTKNFPEITFEAEKIDGVTFHKARLPLPEKEEEARKLLGDDLEVTIGLGEDSAYLAFGKRGFELLVAAIERSKAIENKVIPPSRMVISLSSIFALAAELDDNPAIKMVNKALEATPGKDHITVTATPIERGVGYRLEVEEGVLQAIGKGVQASQPQPQF